MSLRARFVFISAAFGLLLAGSAGCDKGGQGDAPSPGATAAAAATAPSTASSPASAAAPGGSAASAASARPAGSAAAAEPASDAGGGTFKGSYKAKVGAVTPPKDAHVSLWAKDPGTQAVGDGSLTLTLSGAGNRRVVRGEGKGALGDLVLSGEVDGKDVTARVDPKDPNAAGAMTGMFSGKLEGSTIEGTLRVSSRDANLAREADVKLTKGD